MGEPMHWERVSCPCQAPVNTPARHPYSLWDPDSFRRPSLLPSTVRPTASARRGLRVDGPARPAFSGLSAHEGGVAGGFSTSQEAPGGVFPVRLFAATCDSTRNPRLLPAAGRKQRSRGPIHPQVRPRFHEMRVAGGWGPTVENEYRCQAPVFTRFHPQPPPSARSGPEAAFPRPRPPASPPSFPRNAGCGWMGGLPWKATPAVQNEYPCQAPVFTNPQMNTGARHPNSLELAAFHGPANNEYQ